MAGERQGLVGFASRAFVVMGTAVVILSCVGVPGILLSICLDLSMHRWDLIFPTWMQELLYSLGLSISNGCGNCVTLLTVNQRRACIALYGNETLNDSSKPMPWMQQLRGEIDQIM